MIKLLISGDFCPIGRTENYLNIEDYKGLFHDFPNISDQVDYAIVNFECPFTDSQNPISKSGPNIKTANPNTFKALKYAGFDMLTLANNHIQDYGGQGVLDTIEKAKENNFDVIGAGSNKEEAKAFFIKKIKNTHIGFINIAENEFCAATDSMPGANTFDLIENLRTIKLLKKVVDKIILIYHGGREHYQLPTPDQRRRLRFFIENGVDAIVAHHTHCVSGYEYHQDKPIVYSLGNFIFDYKNKYQKGHWTKGMSVILKLINDNFKVELIPHFQGREEDSTLHLLQNEDKDKFLNHVDDLSHKIQDDVLFNQEWQIYLKTQESFYLSSLYVKIFLIRAFFIKKIIPSSLLKFNHNIIMLNLLRCETHHEISKAILKNTYERKNL